MTLLSELSNGLQVPESVVSKIAGGVHHHYKRFSIPKRSGNGNRVVYQPSKTLKGLQRWLSRYVTSRWPVHGTATAYSGHSIKENASRHRLFPYTLRLDLQSFFPSITTADIDGFISAGGLPETGGWDDRDRALFCRLVTFNGGLCIGAPSSPSISNAICFELDRQLEALATNTNTTFTRYADDLFFSSIDPAPLRTMGTAVDGILTGLGCPAALARNVGKTVFLSKKRRRVVTGLVIGSDGVVRIGRERKRLIRAQVHQFPSLTTDQRLALAGMLAFVKDVEPDFLNTLIRVFNQPRVDAARGK